jgi:hypothetical protein
MKKITIIFLASILLFSCERNDMFEVANSGKTKLSITPGDGQLILNWTPVSGAVAYEIYYHTSNDPITAFLDVENYVNTSYTITGLTNGILYYVWLKVLYTAGGTAEIVASGSGIPYMIPDPPVPVDPPTSLTNSLGISWAASSGATLYEVWYSTTPDSGTAVQQGGDINVTSYTLTGLTPPTQYYIWIKAKNSYGTSTFSTPISGIPN